jgi:hypothetical protein
MESATTNFSMLDFVAVIEEAQLAGALSHDVKLVIRGRVDYAVERRDISIPEGEAILAKLGPDFLRSTIDVSAIASSGSL